MKEAKKQLAEWDKELNQLHERNGDLGLEVQNLTEQLETERADREEIEVELTDREEQMRQLLSELSDLKQKSKNDAARKNFPDFPEPADLLNQLKGKRKKSKVELADVATILEILEGV